MSYCGYRSGKIRIWTKSNGRQIFNPSKVPPHCQSFANKASFPEVSN